MKLPKTQLSEIIKLGGFFGGLLGQSMKVRLPLMKSVQLQLGKSILIILGLTAAAFFVKCLCWN